MNDSLLFPGYEQKALQYCIWQLTLKQRESFNEIVRHVEEACFPQLSGEDIEAYNYTYCTWGRAYFEPEDREKEKTACISFLVPSTKKQEAMEQALHYLHMQHQHPKESEINLYPRKHIGRARQLYRQGNYL